MVSMEIIGYPWISLDIRAMYALISIDIWISTGVDVLGYQWISMDIYMDFHGYLWICMSMDTRDP